MNQLFAVLFLTMLTVLTSLKRFELLPSYAPAPNCYWPVRSFYFSI